MTSLPVLAAAIRVSIPTHLFFLHVPDQTSDPNEHFLGNPTALFLNMNGFAWQLAKVAFLGHWIGMVKGGMLLPFTEEIAARGKEGRQASSQKAWLLRLTRPSTCFMTLDKSCYTNLSVFVSPVK